MPASGFRALAKRDGGMAAGLGKALALILALPSLGPTSLLRQAMRACPYGVSLFPCPPQGMQLMPRQGAVRGPRPA